MKIIASQKINVAEINYTASHGKTFQIETGGYGPKATVWMRWEDPSQKHLKLSVADFAVGQDIVLIGFEAKNSDSGQTKVNSELLLLNLNTKKAMYVFDGRRGENELTKAANSETQQIAAACLTLKQIFRVQKAFRDAFLIAAALFIITVFLIFGSSMNVGSKVMSTIGMFIASIVVYYTAAHFLDGSEFDDAHKQALAKLDEIICQYGCTLVTEKS